MDSLLLCIMIIGTVAICSLITVLMFIALDKKEDKKDGEKSSDKESKE